MLLTKDFEFKLFSDLSEEAFDYMVAFLEMIEIEFQLPPYQLERNNDGRDENFAYGTDDCDMDKALFELWVDSYNDRDMTVHDFLEYLK